MLVDYVNFAFALIINNSSFTQQSQQFFIAFCVSWKDGDFNDGESPFIIARSYIFAYPFAFINLNSYNLLPKINSNRDNKELKTI